MHHVRHEDFASEGLDHQERDLTGVLLTFVYIAP